MTLVKVHCRTDPADDFQPGYVNPDRIEFLDGGGLLLSCGRILLLGPGEKDRLLDVLRTEVRVLNVHPTDNTGGSP